MKKKTLNTVLCVHFYANKYNNITAINVKFHKFFGIYLCL